MNRTAIDLLYAPLSDEASAEIAEFLMELALAFEEIHLSQIWRHRESLMPAPSEDPANAQQLPLFDLSNDSF